MHVCMHTCTHVHMHVRTHAHTHACAYVRMRTHLHDVSSKSSTGPFVHEQSWLVRVCHALDKRHKHRHRHRTHTHKLIRHSPLATPHSPLTTRHLPLAIRHSTLAVHLHGFHVSCRPNLDLDGPATAGGRAGARLAEQDVHWWECKLSEEGEEGEGEEGKGGDAEKVGDAG